MISYTQKSMITETVRRAVEAAMSYNCDIERPTSEGRDDYNQPLPPSWQSLTGSGAPFKCSYFPTSKVERTTSDAAYNITQPQLHLPATTDIKTTDRITKLFDFDGNQIGNIFEIISIEEKKTVKVLILKVVD